jgi:hypothetical protein
MALKDHSSCSWRLVAYQDRIAFFWGYFRIGGDSTGTENFRTERLDEYLGDCLNSTAFPAT